MIGTTSSGISYHLRDIYSHSLNNSVDRTYQIEHEIKDNRDTDKSASYHDIQLQLDGSEGRLRRWSFLNRYSIAVKQVMVSTVILSK
jgi:hypothetical protein